MNCNGEVLYLNLSIQWVTVSVEYCCEHGLLQFVDSAIVRQEDGVRDSDTQDHDPLQLRAN